jgi:hypothetical protein
MIDRNACRCASCRARDRRAFERIAAKLAAEFNPCRETSQTSRVWEEAESLASRVAAYTYGRRTTTP